MSIELSLIRRVIDTQGAREAIEFGITENDFTELQAKSAWRIIFNWYYNNSTKGSTIDLAIFQRLFSGIPLVDAFPGQTLPTLCSLVRINRIRRDGTSIMVNMASQMEAPNCNVSTVMGGVVSQLNTLIALGHTQNTDVDIGRGLARQIQRIKDLRAGIDRSVAPWPWEPLQRETLGLQQDDYVVFYGRPKNMKSWVLAYLIAFFFEQQIPIVVYTKEMTPDNVYQRVAACIRRLVYQNFRQGNILDEDMFQLETLADALQNDPQFAQSLIVLSGRDVPPGSDTVEWFKSKLEKYKPRVGLVDGLYLLSGSSGSSKNQKDNERVQSISRGLRGIPLDLGIPIIATNQANRAAAKNREANSDEIAFSDALAQDATLAARVIADKSTPTVSIVVGGSREFKLNGFRINAIPATDFSFHSELSDEEINKMKAEDVEDAKPKKAAKRKAADNPEMVNEEAATQARTNEAMAANGMPS